MTVPAPAVALALAVVLAMTGCASASDGVRIAGSPTADRTPYAGSLTPPPQTAADRPGAAGVVVRCSSTPAGGSAASPYTGGAVATTADGALDVASGEGVFDLATRSLARERTEHDRVLFTTSYHGIARQAVVVRRGPAGPGAGADADGLGWYVESWARCDLADFPDAVSEAYGVQVWSDRDGDRVPTTTVVSSSGPEHCGWQEMTFLELDGGAIGGSGGETYVDRPSADLAGYFGAEAEAHLALPADSVETGYHLGARRLWLAPGHAVAYVGTPEDVAAWPRETRQVGCA